VGLVALIEDYGEAIEYDLQAELDLEVLTFFRAERPWPQLLRLVERLPDHSHYKVAIHDDELAQRLHDIADETGRRQSVRRTVDAHTWTPERAVLTDVADILLSIRSSLEAQRTGKRQKITPMPRPRLARDRIETVASQQRHRDGVRLMLGRGRPLVPYSAGTAYVQILPSLRGFGASADTQISSALAPTECQPKLTLPSVSD
jgi:hypothetical protein